MIEAIEVTEAIEELTQGIGEAGVLHPTISASSVAELVIGKNHSFIDGEEYGEGGRKKRDSYTFYERGPLI